MQARRTQRASTANTKDKLFDRGWLIFVVTARLHTQTSPRMDNEVPHSASLTRNKRGLEIEIGSLMRAYWSPMVDRDDVDSASK